jgi:hypothetical protein
MQGKKISVGVLDPIEALMAMIDTGIRSFLLREDTET